LSGYANYCCEAGTGSAPSTYACNHAVIPLTTKYSWSITSQHGGQDDAYYIALYTRYLLEAAAGNYSLLHRFAKLNLSLTVEVFLNTDPQRFYRIAASGSVDLCIRSDTLRLGTESTHVMGATVVQDDCRVGKFTSVTITEIGVNTIS
jgi:hypothetical protein